VYREILCKKTGMLTVAELANLLNVSQRLIYQLVQSGNLPHLRIGAAVRFDPLVTVDWLDHAEISPRQPSPATIASAQHIIRSAVLNKTSTSRKVG
jgi:excisionase family DNA binding protein